MQMKNIKGIFLQKIFNIPRAVFSHMAYIATMIYYTLPRIIFSTILEMLILCFLPGIGVGRSITVLLPAK